MSYLLLSSSECPKCGKWDFWTYGFDYETYEQVHSCDTCGYEERHFDQEAKDTFEFLKKHPDDPKRRIILVGREQ